MKMKTKMIQNKTLGPTTYPKRHLFLDMDNVRNRKITDLPKDKFLILRVQLTAGEVFGYEWLD